MKKYKKNPASVRKMFSRVVNRYELMNQIMTLGQIRRWQDEIVSLAAPPRGGRLLDLGTGTGFIAAKAQQNYPAVEVVGCDFCAPMLNRAQKIQQGNKIKWIQADALRLPFPGESFDCVTSGYLLRNVVDIDQALREQRRVLKPGGIFIFLETSPPRGFFAPAIRFYFRKIIPLLGQFIASNRQDYSYLSATTERFIDSEQLAARIEKAGFKILKLKKMLSSQTIIRATPRRDGG